MTRARSRSMHSPSDGRASRSTPTRRASMPSLRSGARLSLTSLEDLQQLAGNRSVGRLIDGDGGASDAGDVDAGDGRVDRADSIAELRAMLGDGPAAGAVGVGPGDGAPVGSIPIGDDDDRDDDDPFGTMRMPVSMPGSFGSAFPASMAGQGGLAQLGPTIGAAHTQLQTKAVTIPDNRLFEPLRTTTGPTGQKYTKVPSADDAYTNYLMVTTKTFDDAQDEIAGLRPASGKASKMMSTLRETAVKTTGALDRYTVSLSGHKAFMAGSLHAATGRRTRLGEARKRYADVAEWHRRTAAFADDTHALSQEIRSVEPEIVGRAKAGDTRKGLKAKAARFFGRGRQETASADVATIAAFKARLIVSLQQREDAKRATAYGEQSKAWARKSNLADNKHWTNFKYGAGKVGGKLLQTMSLGLYGGQAKSIEGHRQVDNRLDLLPVLDDFKQIKARTDAVRRSGAMGGERAGQAYSVLQMISQWLLPAIRTVTTGLALWGIVLAPVTVGASLVLTAVCGSLTLAVTALKVVLDLVMTLWSAGARIAHGGYDARKYRTAQVESVVAATEFASNAAYLTTGAGFNSGSGGGWMSPTDAAAARAMDPTNAANNNFGDAGWVGGKTWGWVDRPAMLRPAMMAAAKGTAAPLGHTGNHAGQAYRQDMMLGESFHQTDVSIDGRRVTRAERPDDRRIAKAGRAVSAGMSKAADAAKSLKPKLGGAKLFKTFETNRMALDVMARDTGDVLQHAEPGG